MHGIEIIKLDKKEDRRGWLLKVLLNNQVEPQKEFGEIYVTTSLPGVTRGEHYHEKTCEWFCLLTGKGLLTLVDIQTNQKEQISMDADSPMTIKVPPYIAHSIKNIGEEMLYFLAYSDQAYDQLAPDSIPFSM